MLKAYAQYRKNQQNPLELVMPDLQASYLNSLLDEIGDSELRQHIHLTGYVPNKELPLIYNLAKFFLYPSKRESFGIPILEAMQCGKAVITSTTSSMPEIAQDAALLVDPSSIDAISEAIHELNTNATLRHTLENKGIVRAKDFSWAASAKEVLTHYEAITHA